MKKRDYMAYKTSRGIKFRYMICIIAAIVPLSIVSSCGKKGGHETTDSVTVSDTVTDNAEDEKILLLSSDGIGPVSCPIAIGDLQSYIDGVYDEVMVEEGSDSDIYRFIYAGRERFRGYNFGEESLQMLCASD
ncbi:MAG: hypothetical protein K2I91_04090, partial [Muribaculaceae bacterium]|nr:hypothetical protein [Muribaculaceae bacterium]